MRSPAQPRPSRGDGGFTLVELIVAILIIGVITVPLGNVVVGYLRNMDATTARLMESHDIQIASAYWAQDVASLGTRSPTSPYLLNQSVWEGASSLYSCSTAGTVIVSLAWDDFSGPGAAATVVQVAYVARATPGKTELTELHRLRCNGSSTVVSDVTLSHDLDPDALPTLSCSTTCTSASPPTTLTLTLALTDLKHLYGAYSVTLVGQRRQS
jgi:prepilin-type N-terminal cleavage/methylation domain-containing protein